MQVDSVSKEVPAEVSVHFAPAA